MKPDFSRSATAFAGTFLAVALAAAALAPQARAAQPPRRVVVLPLGSLGVDEDVAASLLAILRSEVSRLPNVSLVDLSKAAHLVGADCRGEEKCLAAAGAKLGADEVVVGTVAGVGESYSIDLKLIRVRGATELRVTETVSGEREVLIDGVRGLTYRLLLPSQYVGAMRIDVADAGADVFVDGRREGRTPLAATISGLTPGKHALKIVKEGFADFDRFVEVRFARVSVVKVDLKSNTIPGVMYEKEVAAAAAAAASAGPAATASAAVEPSSGARAGAWVAGAAGVAALATGAALLALAKADHEELVAPHASPLPADDAIARANRGAAFQTWGAVAVGVGGAAAVASAVLFVLGYQSPVQVTPVVAPHATGLSIGVELP